MNLPTLDDFDCRSTTNTNNETCTFAAPAAGTWHVLVYAYSAISGLTLTASFDEPGACEDGGTESNLSGAAGSEDRYYLDVPACATTFTVTSSGGTGDVDLYVRLDNQPTLSTFDCRSWTPTNNEVCTFQSPAAGRYHILVYGYSAYTGLSLDAGYE